MSRTPKDTQDDAEQVEERVDAVDTAPAASEDAGAEAEAAAGPARARRAPTRARKAATTDEAPGDEADEQPEQPAASAAAEPPERAQDQPAEAGAAPLVVEDGVPPEAAAEAAEGAEAEIELPPTLPAPTLSAPVQPQAKPGKAELRPGQQPRRQMKVGRVVSDKMDKTVIVAVEYTRAHRLYKKPMKRTSKFAAHDERNECHIGDVVRIEETRPLSKTKRWIVREVVQRRVVV
jgi:small subunit ribosomal protein S17